MPMRKRSVVFLVSIRELYPVMSSLRPAVILLRTHGSVNSGNPWVIVLLFRQLSDRTLNDMWDCAPTWSYTKPSPTPSIHPRLQSILAGEKDSKGESLFPDEVLIEESHTWISTWCEVLGAMRAPVFYRKSEVISVISPQTRCHRIISGAKGQIMSCFKNGAFVRFCRNVSHNILCNLFWFLSLRHSLLLKGFIDSAGVPLSEYWLR